MTGATASGGKGIPTYRNPTRIAFGFGALASLEDHVPPGRVALVTTTGATRRGLTARVLSLLDRPEVAIVDDVSPNPEPRQLLRQLEAVPKDVDAVVAVGGGSVLDSGKVLAALAHARRRGVGDLVIAELVRGGTVEEGACLPVVAVPTTAGTGAEVTPFATVWDPDAGQKRSVAGPGLFPTAALVDPEPTLSLPEDVTLSTGLDALSQGLEAWWNRNAGPVTDAFSLRASRLAMATLGPLLRAPEDINLRSRMMEASLLAGLAISGTRTALAHSISYPLTLHFGIPHGIACSYALPSILEYNAEGDGRARMAALADGLGMDTVQELAGQLREILRSLQVGERLRALGFDPKHVGTLGPEMITPGRADNNLRQVDLTRAVEIALKAWEELS